MIESKNLKEEDIPFTEKESKICTSISCEALMYKNNDTEGNLFWECDECGSTSYIIRKLNLFGRYNVETGDYYLGHDLTDVINYRVNIVLNNRTLLSRLKRWWFYGVSPYALMQFLKRLNTIRKDKLSLRPINAAYNLIGSVDTDENKAKRALASKNIKYKEL